ncbi:hypothetical protein ACTXT7_009713 [Hymenolepis weldensis]
MSTIMKPRTEATLWLQLVHSEVREPVDKTTVPFIENAQQLKKYHLRGTSVKSKCGREEGCKLLQIV